MGKVKIKKIIKRVSIVIVGTLVCMTIYLTSTNKLLISFSENDALVLIEDRLNSDSARVIDYVHYSLGKLNLVLPVIVKPITDLKDLNVNDKDDLEIVKAIIGEINNYNYTHLQSNPHLLKSSGGNCQAKSLTFQAYANKYNLRNGIVTEPGHMYNRVSIDGEVYEVDLVKNRFSKI